MNLIHSINALKNYQKSFIKDPINKGLNGYVSLLQTG